MAKATIVRTKPSQKVIFPRKIKAEKQPMILASWLKEHSSLSAFL
jgi:hypothetical protein